MSDYAPGWLIWPLLVKYYRWRKNKESGKLVKNACRTCISVTGGCCKFALYDGWKIFVFPAEAERISQFTGMKVTEFVDTSPLATSQREYIENNREDPLWSKLFSIWEQPGGFKGKCPFLQKEGCPLPYQIKPFICQMYPLDFNVTNSSINFRNDLECLITQAVDTADHVTGCFGDHCGDLGDRFNIFRHEFISLLESLEASQKVKNDQ